MSEDLHRLLCGVWKLISFEVRYPEEEFVHPFGSDPQGYLFYTEKGYMSVVIMQTHRSLFAAGDIFRGSLEELAQSAQTYLSYAGTYEMLGKRIVHSIEVSLFPNWMGQEQIRFIEALTPERLVLKTPPQLGGGKVGVGYLTWLRTP